jgi:hypothetical protein
MNPIDRKFKIFAINPTNGKTYTDQDALLLCAKDAAVPAALEAYRGKCIQLGANEEHIQSVALLTSRVVAFQQEMGGGRIPDTIGAEVARCIHGKIPAYTGNGDNIWEPVEDLMIQTLDSDCNPMKEGDLVPDERQEYGCTVVGFDLDDPEGCRSIMDMTTGEGREADEALARLVVAGLQLIYKTTNPNVLIDERRPNDAPATV